MTLPRRILLLMAAALLAATMALMSAGPVLAQLEAPHQHVLTVPGTGEEHQIAGGTGKCGANLTALNNFHSNVHTNPDHPLAGNIDAAATSCPP
jgi:hypothetical protein